MQTVIIGATGGIGAALTKALADRPDIALVHALSRTGEGPRLAKVKRGYIDILNEHSIAAAAQRIAVSGPPSLVIIASGVLSSGRALQPEKSYRHQSQSAFEQVFAVNTFGPGLVAKHFLPIMPRRGRAVFVALSARIGSITDNRLGGWHAYRASKAALNMLIQNYAIEQARHNPDFIAVGLHPGTVATALSSPFLGNIPDAQCFSPDQSASALLKVIGQLGPNDSGKVFDWAGKSIPA